MHMDSLRGILQIFPPNFLTMKVFGGGSEHLIGLVFLGEDFGKHWCGRQGARASVGIVTIMLSIRPLG